MEEETFHYKKVAEFLCQKEHTFRAYCSIKNIKPSIAIPKSKVLEILEGRIRRLERVVRKNFSKIGTLGLVKKNYRRLKGYHMEEVEQVPSLEETQEPEEKQEPEETQEFDGKYSELEKKTIIVEEEKPVVKDFSTGTIKEPKEKEETLDTPVYSRLQKYLDRGGSRLSLDKMSDLILKEINKYKKKLSPYENNKDLNQLRILYNSLYGIFIERKLKGKIKPCIPTSI